MLAQQQDPDEYPLPLQEFNNPHSTPASLQFQIDVNEILRDLEHSLKCERHTFKKELNGYIWETPKGTKKLINEIGINSILTILKSRLTKIFILSDLENNTIEEITIGIGNNVIDDIYYNWEYYEIRDDAAASLILQLITDTCFATLRKGYKSNYLKFLRTTHSIHETQHRNLTNRERIMDSNDNNDSLMNMLLKRKKR